MPSLPDGIVIFVLALILFGPKRLPVLARELGKWLGEFRRASNEFKMQMEDELRITEQADRQKEIAAIEAAAPPPAPLPGVPTDDPVHPHLPDSGVATLEPATTEPVAKEPVATDHATVEPVAIEPLPIATSGELKLMPPATGLPVAQSSAPHAGPPSGDPHLPLDSLINSIPNAEASENVQHG